MSLMSVVRGYADPDRTPQGGDEARREISEETRKSLIKDLNALHKRNGWLVRFVVGLLVTLFLAALALVFASLDKPVMMQAGAAALGLSAAGCIRWLLGVWREKANTELLVRLAVDLEGEALAAAINVLASTNRLV